MSICIKTQVQFSSLYYVKFFLFSQKNIFLFQYRTQFWKMMGDALICLKYPVWYVCFRPNLISDSVWIHLFLSLKWKKWTFFSQFRSVFVQLQCWPLCNVTFMNTKEFSTPVCYAYMRRERRALYSSAAKVTPTSRIDQKTVLWVKHPTACRAGNEQEGL